MPEAPAPTEPTSTPPEGPKQAQPDDDGKGGKAAVLADLATERDKRQALEQQVTQLTQAQQAQQEALAKAFGLKPEETSDVARLAADVTTLREQFEQTNHENAVLSVANQHGITEKDDLALLRSVKDPDTMRALAQRIAKQGGPSTPKPDLTQGGQSSTGGTGSPEQEFATFLQSQMGR